MMSIWPWTSPEIHIAVLVMALSWDRWMGEPPVAFHPVVWMGNAIGWMRKKSTPIEFGSLCVGIDNGTSFTDTVWSAWSRVIDTVGWAASRGLASNKFIRFAWVGTGW